MNYKAYWSLFAVICLIGLTNCGSGNNNGNNIGNNKATAVESIVAASGTPQSATVGTAFAAPLAAMVTTNGSPTSGVSVTFTAPPGASGMFANGKATETDTTNANGLATSSKFTANGTAGSYRVTASTSGASTSANFSLTNTAVVVTSQNYSFYVSGMEAINKGPNFYAIAGSVTIDASGKVLGGEQDYNDAFGVTSPQPSGDAVSGGTLTVDPTTGQGTLTLNTDNPSVGLSGVETFGVQFVNSSHALIMQFDGTATSGGSIDLQTLPSTLSGGYAFTLTGVDVSYHPLGLGGVFTIRGTTLQSGSADINDGGTVTTGTRFTGTITAGDSFGRGTISGISIGGTAVALNYYIVGPEAIRIIDVDTSDAVVGSAFGQGANATAATNASLGRSVLRVAGNSFSTPSATLGQLTTSNTSTDPADFSGVAEDFEQGSLTSLATPISGTYSIPSNGHGILTVASGNLGSVSLLGIYMTDPTLNLNDPNNTIGGGGGALVLDLDVNLAGGTGVVTPQTDTSTASFTGNYVAGWQDFNGFLNPCRCELDMIAEGPVAADNTLSLAGLVSDPFFTFSSAATSTGDTFSGTPLADGTNPGRYSMLQTNTTPNRLAAVINSLSQNLNVVLYQANGGQLFWFDYDTFSVFLGSLQKQGSLTGMPAARKYVAKPQVKHKE